MDEKFSSWIFQFDAPDNQKVEGSTLKELLNKYFMVIVRGAKFTQESLLDLASEIGTPLRKANMNPITELVPEVTGTDRATTFSSLRKMEWHADRSFDKEIPSFSFLYAVDFGPGAGATHWSNTHQAYMNLPKDLQEKCRALKCVHELKHFADSYSDTIYDFKSQRFQEMAFRSLRTEHPLVQFELGLPYLCMNRGYTSEIVGEGPALLEQLLSYVEDPKVIYSHDWKSGDLVISNNRVLVHKRDPSTSKERKSYRVLLT